MRRPPSHRIASPAKPRQRDRDVNIHHHELGATVADEQALELFRRQWAVRISKESRTALAPAEWLMTQVRPCDLPETVSSWIALGHEAGFAAADELFRAPCDLYRMFCYRA